MSSVAVRTQPVPRIAVLIAVAAVALRSPGWWATITVVAAAAIAAALVETEKSISPYRWTVCVVGGCLVFASVPLLWRQPALAIRPALTAVGASVVAAVAEELLFRRALYRVLLVRGEAVAMLGSAGLFALAHVPNYGWQVLPIDFAAGLIFAWQRHMTGTWTAPAVTHSMANLVQVL
jgi:membrane protease YdiL (CAAX protease family)